MGAQQVKFLLGILLDKPLFRLIIASLAQGKEHLVPNQNVAGSNPARGTSPWSNWLGCHFLKVDGAGSIPVGGTFMRDFLLRVCFALLAQLVEQRTLNPWVAGSSPAGRT